MPPLATRTPKNAHGLTPKQARFVEEYLVDLNATGAARRAGYGKGASTTGYKLLRIPKVAAQVQTSRLRQFEKAELSAVRVLEELRRLAFFDIRDIFDAAGNLRPIRQLEPHVAAGLASVEVVKRNLTAGDGETDDVIKVRTHDKTRNLEMLCKHFGLLVDRVEHSGGIDLVWQEHE
jgi:phage terminase small subunit